MADFSAASPLFAISDGSAKPSGRMAASPATSQVAGSRAGQPPEAWRRRGAGGTSGRLASWSSESGQSSVQSTSAGDIGSEDVESEAPGSPHDIGSMVGRVQWLSHGPEGSRQLQDALHEASNSERELLIKELHGHAIRAMRCPHANHVLQACISTMAPASLQFMIDEIMQHDGLAKKIATHRYGSRVLQKLLAKCTGSQVRRLAEALLQDVVELSRHTFGSHTVRHLLQFGTADEKYRCLRTIEQSMEAIAKTASGVSVIAAAVEHSSSEDRVWIARGVLQDPKLLPHMAQMRQSASAVPDLVDVLPKKEQALALHILAQASADLRASRYGKKVLSSLEARPAHAVVPSAWRLAG